MNTSDTKALGTGVLDDKEMATAVVTATPVGSDAVIIPVIDRRGKLTGYEVEVIGYEGKTSKFHLSVKHGEELIHARLTAMNAIANQEGRAKSEIEQTLMPMKVAEGYRDRLMKLFPETEVPKDINGLLTKAMADLKIYLELGKSQISLDTQQVADLMMKVAQSVLAGDNTIYDSLPKAFKENVDFLLPSISAMALVHAGLDEKAVEAQRRALQINFMGKEEAARRLWDRFPQAGEAVNGFFKGLFGRNKNDSNDGDVVDGELK